MTADYSFESWDDCIKMYGLQKIMKEIFEEDINSEILNETIIFKKFQQVVKGGKKMNIFILCIKVMKGFVCV